MLLVADTHRIGSMPACQPGPGQFRNLPTWKTPQLFAYPKVQNTDDEPLFL